MFSEIRSRNTTGMVSSAPVMARFWPRILLSWPRKFFTSSWATMAFLCSADRASKARRVLGRERMLISTFSSPLTIFASAFTAGGFGALRSISSISASSPSMSAESVCLASSWAVFSPSNFSISALTASSCSVLPGSTSLMACSSSASRVWNSASLRSSSASSAFLASKDRRSISTFSISFLLSSKKIRA